MQGCSQRVFSPWAGPVIQVTDPQFNLAAIVQSRVEEEELLARLDVYDPIDSQSPLSSPPSTPPASRPPSPTLSIPVAPTPAAAQPPSPLEPQAGPSRSHSKQQSRRNRKHKRGLNNDSLREDYAAHPRLRTKHTHAAEPLSVEFDVQTAPHVSSGYVGLVKDTWKRQHSLEELLGPKYNFRHCAWEGSTPTPVVDQQGHVITVLAGHPDDPNWNELHQDAADTLETLRSECSFSEDQRKHRRGRFSALSYGISYGGGQMHPQNLHHNKDNSAMLIALISNLAFIRLAGFASSAFATWAPKMFAYYASHLRDLLLHDARLVVNWMNSIFAAATFNFRPQTLCFRHTDSGNLPFGWCAITALGRFNARRGSHLVLWDLKLVIDFPPGSTILIPSAILRHSNTTIAKGERRYSFTQYTAGGLFRWVDYGFRTSEEYWGSLQGEKYLQAQKERSERWMMGMRMFSTLEELHQ